MNTSAARKYIHKVVKVKVLFQSCSDDFYCDNQQLPALSTNLFALTTISYIIVVVHIKIKNKLSLLGFSQ